MQRHGLGASLVRWWLYNLGAAGLKADVRGGYLRVRYEDLASRPREVFTRICAFLGEEVPENLFLDDRTAVVKVGHQVAGNPMRFEGGEIEIRPDDRWRREMSPWKKGLAWAVTAPLLRAYGYGREAP